MSNKCVIDNQQGQCLTYLIRIKGHLGHPWLDQVGELSITPEEDGTTLLIGRVVDQAALHGILRRIHDLGIVLLSVNSI
jgi:hypothetical protein